MVQWNEASPWTSRLWWFNAVRVGFILWQISHTCGESVWIFMCLFNVPRFFSQAPQMVHWTRGSSMPMCCVFMWSWKPSFVLNTLAHTSHIRWSIRSCTFKMCIFSMWSDLKLFGEGETVLNLISLSAHSQVGHSCTYFFLQMSQMNFWSPIGCTSLRWRFKMCCLLNRLWHWWHSKLRFSSSKCRNVCAVNVLFSWNFFGHFVQLMEGKHTQNPFESFKNKKLV